MTTAVPPVPESCAQCPYVDAFHSNCSHPDRQLIIQQLAEDLEECPVFPELRSEAMQRLEDRLADD